MRGFSLLSLFLVAGVSVVFATDASPHDPSPGGPPTKNDRRAARETGAPLVFPLDGLVLEAPGETAKQLDLRDAGVGDQDHPQAGNPPRDVVAVDVFIYGREEEGSVPVNDIGERAVPNNDEAHQKQPRSVSLRPPGMKAVAGQDDLAERMPMTYIA